MPKTTFKASAHLQEGMRVVAKAREFEFTIDEPKSLGGTDTGMNPVEAVLAALGGCQAIVARVYARKFNIKFDDLWIEVEGDLDTDGFMNISDVRRGYSEIRYTLHIATDSPKEKVAEFVSFMENTCPVGDTLANPVSLKLNDIVIENTKVQS